MNAARITIIGDAGTIYSWIEVDEHYDEGDFARPFEKAGFEGDDPADYTGFWTFGPEECDDPKSPIYGFLESIAQSDDRPYFLSREKIVGGQLAWIGENPEDTVKIDLPRHTPSA